MIVEHSRDDEYPDGKRCPEWDCYGFEESKTITLWFPKKHGPLNNRRWPAHWDRRSN